MRGKPTSNKLQIFYQMKMFDQKNRDFYDELTEEEKRKFSNYLMIRWGSGVRGSSDLQEYYLHATNQRLNKRFFDINKHPKLQWLCATTVSPDMGTQQREWIGFKKKDSDESNNLKKLKQIYPSLKLDDLEVLATVVDKKELSEYKKKLGE